MRSNRLRVTAGDTELEERPETREGRMRKIDLIYFDGCPNVEDARANLRAAVDAEGGLGDWEEWALEDSATPERFRGYGSPTVLVDGADVTGVGKTGAAMSCRADGAPSVQTIRGALRRG